MYFDNIKNIKMKRNENEMKSEKWRKIPISISIISDKSVSTLFGNYFITNVCQLENKQPHPHHRGGGGTNSDI